MCAVSVDCAAQAVNVSGRSVQPCYNWSADRRVAGAALCGPGPVSVWADGSARFVVDRILHLLLLARHSIPPHAQTHAHTETGMSELKSLFRKKTKAAAKAKVDPPKP
jgi:hypothetical protein